MGKYKKLAPYIPPAQFDMQQMMQAMQGAKMPGKMPMPAKAAAPGAAVPEAPVAGAAMQIAPREGAPLALSAGTDPAVVSSKIQEIAKAIIGEADEDIELDTPLMQAGITSNTAVILRDQLSQDLPGVNLPPTLMFDYPSIGAISEFIVDRIK